MKKYIIAIFFSLIFFCVYPKTYSQNQFWEQIAFSGRSVNQFAIDRQNNLYVSAVDTDGINKLFKSTDGISWEVIFIPFQEGDPWPVKMLIDTTNLNYDKIYVLKQIPSSLYHDSLFVSIDSGESWNILPLPQELNPTYKIKQMAYKSNGDLFIVSYNKVHYTTNEGNTWEVLINGDSVG